MTSAVCTLFEGHYHLGAAALINSLHASGFRGRVVCGFRGALPPWASPLRKESGDTHVLDLGQGLEVWFVALTTKIHFTNYKPRFLLDTWETAAGNPDTYYYLDPDIVVKCKWEVMERWAQDGIALCEDVNYYLPPRHPLRIGWLNWFKSIGVQPGSIVRERYYSGGFIGVPRLFQPYLARWDQLIAAASAVTGTLDALKQGDPNFIFHSTDQDAMNAALMVEDVPVNATGPEGMDFAVGGHLLSHAIGSRKPWRGGFVAQALRGYPPSAPAKAFFNYTASPLRVFTEGECASFRRQLAIAAFIGRFYRRA